MIFGDVDVVVDGLVGVIKTGILHGGQLALGIAEHINKVSVRGIIRSCATWLNDQSMGVQVRRIGCQHRAHRVVKYVLCVWWRGRKLVHEANAQMVPGL